MAIQKVQKLDVMQRGIIRGLEMQYGSEARDAYIGVHALLGRRLAMLELGIATFDDVVASFREMVSFDAYELGQIPASDLPEHTIKRQYIRREIDVINNCIRDVLATKTLGEAPAQL